MWVVGGWVVEGKFRVMLWAKPSGKALDLDFDQAEQKYYARYLYVPHLYAIQFFLLIFLNMF